MSAVPVGLERGAKYRGRIPPPPQASLSLVVCLVLK